MSINYCDDKINNDVDDTNDEISWCHIPAGTSG